MLRLFKNTRVIHTRLYKNYTTNRELRKRLDELSNRVKKLESMNVLILTRMLEVVASRNTYDYYSDKFEDFDELEHPSFWEEKIKESKAPKEK